jgi:hypothetical protein
LKDFRLSSPSSPEKRSAKVSMVASKSQA